MVFNGRFLTQRTTGVQRFARELVSTGAKQRLFKDAALLCPDVEIPSFAEPMLVRRCGRLKGHPWEQLELPRAAGRELLVNLCNTAPLMRERQLVVLHDAAVAALPRNFTPAFRAWYRLMISAYGKRARLVATVSRFSAEEITRHFHIPPAKIEVIPESGEHMLRDAPDYSLHAKFGLETDGYILAVSSYAANKNFAGILKALALLPGLPYRFVIGGARDNRIFNAAQEHFPNAVETGYASDAQLRALYERAACFVYPSFYEGFGLPPLEAMTCGCPVLASDIPSLRETCGDGAAYCDPHAPDDIARALSRLLESRAARDELRKAGLARARQFTWGDAAARLAELTSQAI